MRTLFWNVDTQKDFMNKGGALYVEGAEEIKHNLQTLTAITFKNGIKVVNTGDCHTSESKELSDKPDFKTTFPEHCMAGSEGLEFIVETSPQMSFRSNYYIVDCSDKGIFEPSFNRARNIIIFKDDFDVFKGNPHTNDVLELIEPDSIVVYGVATNVCVNFAVLGLLKRSYQVGVVVDAIKGLPGLPVGEIKDKWIKEGAVLIKTEHVENFIMKGGVK